jgi:hypothetical protein
VGWHSSLGNDEGLVILHGSCTANMCAPTITMVASNCAYLKIALTFSRICWLRDGFR